VALLIFSLSIGILIGLRNQILVVIPVTLCLAATCYAIGAAIGPSGYASLSAIILAAISLQGGYMIGLTSRNLGQSLARPQGVKRV
jgi:hypothetical protein